MRVRWRFLLASMIVFSSSASLLAQGPVEKVDTETVAKIREEGLQRSKVMETISFLTDVYGPRLTGSPLTKIAGEWAKGKLTEWGLENSHLESWGPFGRGWTLEGVSVNMVKPNFSPIIAYPKAWSPSTPKTIRGVPIYLDASTPEELEKYRGKLSRAIVLISPPREVKAQFEAPGTRKTDAELLALANAEPPSQRGGRGGGPRGGRPDGNRPAEAPGTPPAAGAAPPAATPTPPTTPPAEGSGRPTDGRSQMQLQADKWQMAYDEGAAVVLEPGRGDGGTVFVSGATMPRRAESARTAEVGNPFSRGPRPWAPDAPEILPQAVIAAEHYNRLVRMIQKGEKPELEVDIEAQYHVDELNSFNIIAEIPGTDLKDEIVMLGAHFDSWQSGTGATDNAIGCGVAMEAVRILKAIGVQPRRTIRIGLWTGEEQGLLGSRAYVNDHFGKMVVNTPAPGAPEAPVAPPGERAERPKPTYELKPEHEKLSVYFNLDNGTGKVRGIYLQGNEALRPVFRAWLAPFADLGASTITASNTGGTDHQSFDGVGLPGFQFIQDPIEYDTRTHHSSMDVYERIQEDDAKQASVIMAAFVYLAANRDEKLTRKPLEGNVITSPTPTTEPAPAVAAPVDVPPPAPAAAAATN